MTFVKNKLWAAVLVGIIIAFVFPVIGILLSPFLQLMFIVLMFFSSLKISFTKVLSEIKHPGHMILVLLLVHIGAPLLLLLLKPFLAEQIYVGLILAVAVPVGISSVFLTHLFKGDTERSLVITTLSSLMSPVVIPLTMFIFASTSIHIDFVTMITTTTKLTVVPFILARLVSHTEWMERLEKHSSLIMETLLIVLVVAIIGPVRNYILGNLATFLILIAIVGTLNVILFAAGFALGRNIKSKISYGISSYFKNFALANVLAFSLFNATVALPAIAFAVMNSFLLIPMEWFLEGRRKS